MTVATDTGGRYSYTGNGVTTTFSFPSLFLANADLKVIRKKISDGSETLLVLDTDYTITGAGVQAGGSITTIGAISPISSAYKITIYQDPEKIQEMDLVENDPLPAETAEMGFDKLTLIAQRLANWISRTMKLSEGTPDGVFDPTLPVDIILYPDSVPTLNSTATGWAVASLWPTTVDLAAAEANAAAAAASAAAAAASAVAAAAASAANFGNDVLFKTFADSPITLTDAHKGNIIAIDDSGGAVVVNLPAVSGLDFANPWVLGIKKVNQGGNTITINRNGTDQFENAGTSKVIRSLDEGYLFIPDTDPAPDRWTTIAFGSSGSGSGGGALRWIEGSSAPIMGVEVDQEVYSYEAAQAQDLFTNIKVPTGYVAGLPIKLKLPWLSNDSSGNVLLRAQATLIRPGTSVITATTNQRTTTNTAVTVSGATQEIPQVVTLDLTDTAGAINSVAVAAGDLIKVRLYRDTDTATGNVRALPYNAEVTFS